MWPMVSAAGPGEGIIKNNLTQYQPPRSRPWSNKINKWLIQNTRKIKKILYHGWPQFSKSEYLVWLISWEYLYNPLIIVTTHSPEASSVSHGLKCWWSGPGDVIRAGDVIFVIVCSPVTNVHKYSPSSWEPGQLYPQLLNCITHCKPYGSHNVIMQNYSRHINTQTNSGDTQQIFSSVFCALLMLY